MSHNHSDDSEIVFPKFKVERGEKRAAYNGNEFPCVQRLRSLLWVSTSPWQVDMGTPGD